MGSQIAFAYIGVMLAPPIVSFISNLFGIGVYPVFIAVLYIVMLITIKCFICYAPIYIWVRNDICTIEIIDSQLAEMMRLGIRAFYILLEPKEFRPDSMPTNLELAYHTPQYFELCAYAVEKGKALGMQCWIYD